MSFTPEFIDALWRLFELRRDVRSFEQTPVPAGDLDRVLAAAHMAPSVGLSQPWRFVVVESPEVRAQVVESYERESERCAQQYDDDRARAYRSLKLAGLRDAPVHLLVCAESDPEQGHGLGRQSHPDTVAYSAVCAVQNLWLAARAIGLGVGWVSILEPDRLVAAMSLPLTWEWIAYLCLGTPRTVDDAPELERRGWEQRVSVESVVHRR